MTVKLNVFSMTKMESESIKEKKYTELNEPGGIIVMLDQQFDILTSVDLDEPPQHPVKLRNSKWCSVSSLTIIEYSRE